MRPVHQTQFAPKPGDPKATGNCMAACAASLLELDLDEVPNFAAIEGDDGEYFKAFNEWLAERGWYCVPGYGGDFPYPCLTLASGKSPRGDFHHLVVMRAGEIVHDPHPSGAGFDGDPIDQWLLVPLDPGEWVRKAR